MCCSPPWIKPLFRGSRKAADHSPPVALNGFKLHPPFPLPTCDNQQACRITPDKALVTVFISGRSHTLSIPCYLEMKATDSPQATDPRPSAEPPTDLPTDPLTDPPTNPPTDPPVNPPTDPPTYFSTDPYLVPSLESPRFLVPHGLVSTPPHEIPEVHNRSGRTSLPRWTRDDISYIPGGRESYISATDKPPPYYEDLEKTDDRDVRKDEGEGDRKKRQNNKTPIACDFCRMRKLKCSGSRPSCHNCKLKGECCKYAKEQRRRGPGRKNKGLPPQPRGGQQEIDEPTEASTSTSTTSTFTFQHQPASSYHPQAPLPGPPIPQYNYDLGQIQSSSFGLRAGTLSRSGESSSSREPHRFELYPQPEYTTPPEHGNYAQQPRQEQYHRRLTAHEHQRSQPSHLYRDEYPQASTSRADFQSGPLAERQSTHPSEVGDNEGTSRSQLKRRRVPSPPEDIGPSNPKKRRYYDPDEDGD